MHEPEYDDYSEASSATLTDDPADRLYEEDPALGLAVGDDSSYDRPNESLHLRFEKPNPAWIACKELVGEAILDELIARGIGLELWEDFRRCENERRARGDENGGPPPTWRQCTAQQSIHLRERIADFETDITSRLITDPSVHMAVFGSPDGQARIGRPSQRAIAPPLRKGQGIDAESILRESFARWPLNGARSELCHGYANCCSCESCGRREPRNYRLAMSYDSFEAVQALVHKEAPRVFGESTRGGARKRGEQTALVVRRPEGQYRYDFRRRQNGRGGAGADKYAIRDWLTSRLVSGDRKRWLVARQEREMVDYAPITGRKGGRTPREQMPLLLDLSQRLVELHDAGAYKRSIAEVLGVNENTVGRLLDRANRRYAHQQAK
jgi:hypothetical protein